MKLFNVLNYWETVSALFQYWIYYANVIYKCSSNEILVFQIWTHQILDGKVASYIDEYGVVRRKP